MLTIWTLVTSCEDWPVFTKYGVLQNDLLQKLNELIGQICGHKRLHRHRHFLRILRLRQSGLNHLCTQSSSSLWNNHMMLADVWGGTLTWSISGRLKGFVSSKTPAHRSGSFRRTRYRDSLLNKEFSLHTYKRVRHYKGHHEELLWVSCWMDLNLYELQVTLASLIGHEGQVRVSLLAVAAHRDAVVVQVL